MEKCDVIIGVDIGLTGGIAFFDTVSAELLSVYPMPTKEILKNGKKRNALDLDKLCFILEIPKVHKEKAIVVFEDVHAFPGQGSVSTGVLMEQKGIIRGMAIGLGYEECPISPKTWQTFYGMVPPKELKGSSASKTKTLRKEWLKAESLSNARRLFPLVAETKLASKNSHGLSDSLLIGNWYIKQGDKDG